MDSQKQDSATRRQLGRARLFARSIRWARSTRFTRSMHWLRAGALACAFAAGQAALAADAPAAAAAPDQAAEPPQQSHSWWSWLPGLFTWSTGEGTISFFSGGVSYGEGADRVVGSDRLAHEVRALAGVHTIEL